MTRGIGPSKKKTKTTSLIEKKDYITEAYLQGGKAIGALLEKHKKKTNQ
jgi:hypothetical protein